MGWIIFIIIVITAIYVAVKVRQIKKQLGNAKKQYTSNANAQVPSTPPCPPHITNAINGLSDPAMKAVANTAWRITNIERSLDNAEIEMVKNYISDYAKLVPHSDEFCFYEAVIGLAHTTFVDIFQRKWPKMLYKSFGFVDVNFFISQLAIQIGKNKISFGNKHATDYDAELDMGYEDYLEMWKERPSEEARVGNIPTEQTNWYAVIKWLSAKAKNPTYITYPMRYAQEMLRIKDPDLRFIGDFACRVMQDNNHVHFDIDTTKKFVQKYVECGDNDVKFQEMVKYASTLSVALTSFITTFMLQPELLYKNAELIKLSDFTSQLDVECQKQAGDNSELGYDYRKLRENQRQYRDKMLNFPEMEAKSLNIPAAQTNWHEVVRQLSNVVDD